MACNIRRATTNDIPGIQECWSLCTPDQPESLDFFLGHLLTWPPLAYVAEEPKGRIVGHVLGRVVGRHCDKCSILDGHISSICVCRSYRGRGIATKLMNLVQEAMESIYLAERVLIYLRKSHRVALGFYTMKMGYKQYFKDLKDEDRFAILTKALKGKEHCDQCDDLLDHCRETSSEHFMRPARRPDAVSDEDAEAGPSSRCAR